MKSEKGVTLIIAIMTVLLLMILVGLLVTNGMQTFKDSKVIKFQSYMKIIQKEVDVMVEEQTDYTTVGSTLTESQLAKIQTIVKAGGCYTKEADLANAKWRYFSTYDISTIFGISNVSDDIVVNFANRDVVSLKGIEKNGVTHYSEYTL